MMARAIFLDRDGTLVESRHYPSRPEDLVLCPGVGPALKRLQDLGFLLVVVTNQSGLARGFFSEADLEAMHTRLRAMLVAHGVRLDAIEHCPHHVDGVVAKWAIACECRKPAPGMIFRSARSLNIDPSTSWMVGDNAADVGAGFRAGCRTGRVLSDLQHAPSDGEPEADVVAATTADVLEAILQLECPIGGNAHFGPVVGGANA